MMECMRCKDRTQLCTGGLGCEMARFGQAFFKGVLVEPNVYNPTKKGMDEERARCVAILEAEIARGESLIGLLDQAGRPVFDDKTTRACIEALQYCLARIKDLPSE